MREHYRIKEAIWPVLEKAGFGIESENSQLDYYGSIRSVFVRDEKRVLLEWDGEEGFGYAEVWKSDEWESLPTKVLEARETEFQAAIQRLIIDLQDYIL
jgi:hypothetical protein